jgi:DNA-binding CsgD family transcriptional regulator
VAGYRRQIPAARPFLIASVVVVGSMLSIPLYHLLTDLNSMSDPFVRTLLTDLVSVAQTFGFSVALVARTRSLQKELLAREREARQLETDLQELGLKHQLIVGKNQEIITGMHQAKTRNEQLQEKLEANQRELASSALYIAQKNELLAKLKTQIKELNKLYPENKHQGLQDIESTLQSSLYLDADWSKFKLHFEQVHPHFFENLQANHPNLTINEVRLCAYSHMNLSIKEIATLLNIDPASVRRSKTRLSKKMEVNSGNIIQSRTLQDLQLSDPSPHFTARNELIQKHEEQNGSRQAMHELVQTVILTGKNWGRFRELFEQVHPGYLQRLVDTIPDISPSEIKLMALAKLNFSNKEMAAALGVAQQSIRVTWFRLRKKADFNEEGTNQELVNLI